MTSYTVRIGDQDHVVAVEETTAGRYTVRLPSGRTVEAQLSEGTAADVTQAAPTPTPAPAPTPARPQRTGPSAQRNVGAASPLTDALPDVAKGVASPLPGVVVSCLAAPGDRVTRGQTVVVIEAMKMNNDIKAPRDAVIAKVLVAPGDKVQHGSPLIEFEL
jgi:glutaconyl-CoA decarboxylase